MPEGSAIQLARVGSLLPLVVVAFAVLLLTPAVSQGGACPDMDTPTWNVEWENSATKLRLTKRRYPVNTENFSCLQQACFRAFNKRPDPAGIIVSFSGGPGVCNVLELNSSNCVWGQTQCSCWLADRSLTPIDSETWSAEFCIYKPGEPSPSPLGFSPTASTPAGSSGSSSNCGLGFEFALVLALLLYLRGRPSPRGAV